MMTVRDTLKRGEALCGTSAHCVRSCARHTRLLGRKHEPWGGQRCAHPSVLRASQQRDRIAVLVRRNAEGKEEQEGEAEEHRVVPCFGASSGASNSRKFREALRNGRNMWKLVACRAQLCLQF